MANPGYLRERRMDNYISSYGLVISIPSGGGKRLICGAYAGTAQQSAGRSAQPFLSEELSSATASEFELGFR